MANVLEKVSKRVNLSRVHFCRRVNAPWFPSTQHWGSLLRNRPCCLRIVMPSRIYTVSLGALHRCWST